MTSYVIIPPDLLPMSLERARAALRVDDDDTSLDDEITDFIAGVTEEVENYIGQSIMPQTWRVQVDAVGIVALPHPARQVVGVTYRDSTGATVPLPVGQFRIQASRYESWLVGPTGFAWPATDKTADAVTIDVEVGIATSEADVPRSITLHIKQRIKQQFDPAARVERDTEQSKYTVQLLDKWKVKP